LLRVAVFIRGVAAVAATVEPALVAYVASGEGASVMAWEMRILSARLSRHESPLLSALRFGMCSCLAARNFPLDYIEGRSGNSIVTFKIFCFFKNIRVAKKCSAPKRRTRVSARYF
jgi:hypothetical protein